MAAYASAATRFARALSFVSRKHRWHRRGVSHDPVPRDHHLDVARLLMEVGQVTDETTVVAGVLHDVLELTTATRSELEREFGAPVRQLVDELTCAGDHSPADRRRRHLASTGRLSPPALVIRLADAVATLQASQHLDRADQRELVEWSSRLVVALRRPNLPLVARLHQAAVRVGARIGAAPLVPLATIASEEETRPTAGPSKRSAAPSSVRSNTHRHDDPLHIWYAREGVGSLTFEPIDGRHIRVRVDEDRVSLSIQLAALLEVLAFAEGDSPDRFPPLQTLKAVAAALGVRTGRSHSVAAVVMALTRLQDALKAANINPCFVDRTRRGLVRFRLRRSQVTATVTCEPPPEGS